MAETPGGAEVWHPRDGERGRAFQVKLRTLPAMSAHRLRLAIKLGQAGKRTAMEDILITTDPKGGKATLTTDSPQSHYGTPVLRIEAEDVEGDFGPADLIGWPPKMMYAAEVVAGWARQPERTDDERVAAGRFLRQWPEGPQVDRPRRYRLTNERYGNDGTPTEFAAMVRQFADVFPAVTIREAVVSGRPVVLDDAGDVVAVAE